MWLLAPPMWLKCLHTECIVGVVKKVMRPTRVGVLCPLQDFYRALVKRFIVEIEAIPSCSVHEYGHFTLLMSGLYDALQAAGVRDKDMLATLTSEDDEDKWAERFKQVSSLCIIFNMLSVQGEMEWNVQK